MNFRDSGYALTYLGLAGIVFVSVLGLEFAPGLKPCTEGGCWGAPEAYRILYLHVPFAWCSFLSFSVLLDEILPKVNRTVANVSPGKA